MLPHSEPPSFDLRVLIRQRVRCSSATVASDGEPDAPWAYGLARCQYPTSMSSHSRGPPRRMRRARKPTGSTRRVPKHLRNLPTAVLLPEQAPKTIPRSESRQHRSAARLQVSSCASKDTPFPCPHPKAWRRFAAPKERLPRFLRHPKAMKAVGTNVAEKAPLIQQEASQAASCCLTTPPKRNCESDGGFSSMHPEPPEPLRRVTRSANPVVIRPPCSASSP
jgi:hypothetical protein